MRYKHLPMVKAPDINWEVNITIDKTKLKKNEYAIVTIQSNMPFTSSIEVSDNLKAEKLTDTSYKVTLIDDEEKTATVTVTVKNSFYPQTRQKTFIIKVLKDEVVQVPNNVSISTVTGGSSFDDEAY